MKYAYMNDGGPMSWKGLPPRQSQAADARSLGSLGGTTLDQPTLTLPAPGAPEPMNGIPSCKCGGSCGCSGGGLHGLTDTLTESPLITLGVAYLAYRLFFKKKR